MPFDPEKICPVISTPLQSRKCAQHKCHWFVQIQGANPQSGEKWNDFACAIAWQPYLQIETSQQARQAGAAIESLRNEVLRRQEENGKVVSLIAEILKAIYERLTGARVSDVKVSEPPREHIRQIDNSAAR